MPDMLIVGGLTVDRFADGRRAPGGSVIHAGRAAGAAEARLTTLAIAGDEPEAREGLAQLDRLGTLRVQPAGSTTTYGHGEADGRRVLVYEVAGEPLRPASLDGLPTPEVALLAPIADELPAHALAELRRRLAPRLTVMLIQGWLRRLEVGEPVHPLPLDQVATELWEAFGHAAAIVVSTEDLAEQPADPFLQAAALRRRLGRGPVLVLTLGAEGYLLDDPGADRIVANVPREVVRSVPTVGAGDTFGAVLAVHLARGDGAATAAQAAAERVIRVLEDRR